MFGERQYFYTLDAICELQSMFGNNYYLWSAKQAKVTDAQVNAYLRMFPAKKREDAIKELSEVAT